MSRFRAVCAARRFLPRAEALDDRTLPATVLPPGFAESPVAGGLTLPTAMEFAPDGRLFVAEKGGTLRIIQNGALLPTPFLTVPVNSVSERGLVGVTLDPNFAVNRFVYVYYTSAAPQVVNRVSRFTADPANPNVVLGGSEVVLLDNIPSTNGNHNGGALHFGADGKLYVGVGDAGTSANAQLLSTLSGKILRLDPAAFPIVIPVDNPFVGTPGACGEIWALGFRNPFTFAVQPGTGRVFVNDVGAATFEEVDELFKGANYGWANAEGPSNDPRFVNPIYAYAHQGGNAAITGGAFYQAGQFPADFQGAYFFADYILGFIRVLRPAAGNAVAGFATDAAAPVDLDVGPDGSLYYLSISQGTVFQVRFTGAPEAPGRRLVVTGAGQGGAPRVEVFDPATGALRNRFLAYGRRFHGGVRVAVGDVSGDGFAEVVTAPGPGAAGHVKVFDGRTGALLRSFLAFSRRSQDGVFVAAADVNGDGFADVIAGLGDGPLVRIFDGRTGVLLRQFRAFGSASGGVTVAASDFNGDGLADVLAGSGSRVRAFRADGTLLFGLRAGGAGAGVFVAAGDVTGDGRADVLTGAGPGGPPRVQIFDGVTHARRASFLAASRGDLGGVQVAATDVSGDGLADVLTVAAVGRRAVIRARNGLTLALLDRVFTAFGTPDSGVFLGTG